MNSFELALQFTSKYKVRVFPCTDKHPSIKNPHGLASDTPEGLKRLFIDEFTGMPLPRNVAMTCTEDSLGRPLLGVDIDCKDGKNGFKTLEELDFLGFEFTPTLTQRTCSGGRHYIYWTESKMKNGVNSLGNGIDTRGFNGYLLAAGSRINGQLYTIEHDHEITKAPDWLIERLGKIVERPILAPVISIDQRIAEKRAIEFLGRLPVAKQGERNKKCFDVAAQLKNFGVPEQKAVELILKYWRCE